MPNERELDELVKLMVLSTKIDAEKNVDGITAREILNTPAGTRMNTLIWWKIFDMNPTPPNNDMLLLPDYSGDLNVAKTVSDKMKGFVLVRSRGEYCCNHIAFAETPPLAICRAALLEALGFA